jgi:hypothetical protein
LGLEILSEDVSFTNRHHSEILLYIIYVAPNYAVLSSAQYYSYIKTVYLRFTYFLCLKQVDLPLLEQLNNIKVLKASLFNGYLMLNDGANMPYQNVRHQYPEETEPSKISNIVKVSSQSKLTPMNVLFKQLNTLTVSSCYSF